MSIHASISVIKWTGGVVASALAAMSVSFFIVGGTMEELIQVLDGLGEHWQGAIVLLVALLAALVGPLVYVLRRQMDLQQSEGAANRAMVQDIAKLQRSGSAEVAAAVRRVELVLENLNARLRG